MLSAPKPKTIQASDTRVVQTNGLDRTSDKRWRWIWKHMLPPGKGKGRVLDAGCGEHVWSASDYAEVIRADNWQAYLDREAEMPSNILDLDLCREPWPIKERGFDGVVAVDVVEHLENIWCFFREAFRVSKRFVIIATPNVHSPLSKALYQRNGRFWAFTPGEVKKSVHVTPVFDWQLVEAARRAGWVVKSRHYTHEPYKAMKAIPPNLHQIAKQEPNQRSAVIRFAPRPR